MNKTYTILLVLGFFFLLPSAFAGSAAPSSASLELTGTEAPAFDRTDKKAERAQRKALRKQIREMKKAQRDDQDVLEIVLAILIPPLGVYLHEDEINNKFWICLGLWAVGYVGLVVIFGGLLILASVVYALLVVLDKI